MNTATIATAVRLLRNVAKELQQSHTTSINRDDWEREPDAKAAYDEHMAAAAALEAIPEAAEHLVLPEPAAVVTFEWRKKPDVKWLIDTVVRGTKLYTEQQVRALLGGVSAPAAEGSVIRWVSNGLIGARPTTHDLREAIAVAEDCQRCDCTDCTKAMTLPLKLVEAINTAVGSNEWQGDSVVTDLLEPACKVVANLTHRAQADQKARMKIAAALGHEGVNFAWSYLTGAIKELVKADGEHLELQPQALAFQQRVQPWMMACFGPEISADRIERNHRFLEEALELVQSCGSTASEAHQLVDYVFARPVGDPMQEAGGVMVTLAALCLASGLDMHACGEAELARIWTKVEAIRAKQAAKPKHSPLPMHAPQTQDALRLAFVLSEIRRDGMDALGAALHDADGFPLDHKASLEAIDRAANAAASGK